MTDHDRISDEAAARLRLMVRAFEIADAAMIVAATCYGVPNGEDRYGMANGDGQEVRTVAEAGEEMREAVEWLTARGLATVARDAHGDVLTLAPVGRDPARPYDGLFQGIVDEVEARKAAAAVGRTPERPGDLVPLAGGGSVDLAGSWKLPK